MGVILRAAYRQAQGVSVPCPADKDTPNAPWWYDHLAAKAKAIKAARFSAVMLPPIHKVQGGCGPGCDGYAVYDEDDWGSIDQQGSIPTRFGTADQLASCVRQLQEQGIEIYADWVPHQRLGGSNGVYDTPPFPKTPSCFTGYDSSGVLLPGRVPRDPIAGPVIYDSGVYGFGDELCPINGLPKGYVMAGLIAASAKMSALLGIKGWRDDDVKGQAVEAVKQWAASLPADHIVIGEYVDSPQTLNWWCWESGLEGRCYAYDFPFQGAMREMCNNSSNWDMRRLLSPGLCFANLSPSHAVLFIESPDTDVNGYESVIWNKAQGYFFMLTFLGYPEVYWRDWSDDPGCYNLSAAIDNYIWIHENKAQGAFIPRYGDFQHAVYERDGNLICAINNDRWSGWWTYWGPTNFPAGTWLKDYTGHNSVWSKVDENGWVAFGVPENNNGLGTVAFGKVEP